jgi:hypothetical protein
MEPDCQLRSTRPTARAWLATPFTAPSTTALSIAQKTFFEELSNGRTTAKS